MQVQIETIPGGAAGLRRKIARIRELVEAAKRDPWFRDQVVRIVGSVPEKDYRAERERVIGWVMRHVRYVRDPHAEGGLELFTTPQRMLRDILRTGRAHEDCDGHVILAAAMLETIGHPTRYRVGAVAPGDYRHIWLDVRDPRTGQWHAYELTDKGPYARGIGDPSGHFPIVETYDHTVAGLSGEWYVYPAQRAINLLRSRGLDVRRWMQRVSPNLPRAWMGGYRRAAQVLGQRVGLYRRGHPVCDQAAVSRAWQRLARERGVARANTIFGRLRPGHDLVPGTSCVLPDPRRDEILEATITAAPLWFSRGHPLSPAFRGRYGPPAGWKPEGQWRRALRKFVDNPIGPVLELIPGFGTAVSVAQAAAQLGPVAEALATQGARKRMWSRIAREDLSRYQLGSYHGGAMKTPTPIEIVPTGGPNTTAVRIAHERWYRDRLPSDVMRARGLGDVGCPSDGLGFFLPWGRLGGGVAKAAASSSSFWDDLLKFGSGFLDVAERIAPIGMQAYALYQQERRARRAGREFTGPTWNRYLMDWAGEHPEELEHLASQIGGPIRDMVDGAFGEAPPIFRRLGRSVSRRARDVREYGRGVEWEMRARAPRLTRAVRDYLPEPTPPRRLLDWTGEFLPDIDGLAGLGDGDLPWPAQLRTPFGVVRMIGPDAYFPDIGHTPTPGWTSGADRELREWYPHHFGRAAERAFRNPAMAAYDLSMWFTKHVDKLDSKKDVQVANKALRWLERRIVTARRMIENQRREAERRRKEAERRRKLEEERRRQEEILRRKQEEARRKLLEEKRKAQEAKLRKELEEKLRRLREQQRRGGTGDDALRREIEELRRRLREQSGYRGRMDAGGGTLFPFGPPPPPPPPKKRDWTMVLIAAGVAVVAGLAPALLRRRR